MDGSKSASFTKQSAFETVRNTIFVKKIVARTLPYLWLSISNQGAQRIP